MRVSIITVCYNAETFISSAIESVVQQDYPNIEYIIVDGGSQDSTLKVIERYGRYISCLISEPDKGIYDAMNKGLAMANGDVICILNSDDFYPVKDCVSLVVQAFENNPYAQIVLGDVEYVKQTKPNYVVRKFISHSFSLWNMHLGFAPAHPASFIRRSAYDEVGWYKSSYYIAADFDWFLRSLLVHKLSFVQLSKTLVRMRIGGVSSSGIRSYWISSKEMIRAFRENEIYSNWFFIILRLPLKYWLKVKFMTCFNDKV